MNIYSLKVSAIINGKREILESQTLNGDLSFIKYLLRGLLRISQYTPIEIDKIVNDKIVIPAINGFNINHNKSCDENLPPVLNLKYHKPQFTITSRLQ